MSERKDRYGPFCIDCGGAAEILEPEHDQLLCLECLWFWRDDPRGYVLHEARNVVAMIRQQLTLGGVRRDLRGALLDLQGAIAEMDGEVTHGRPTE